MRLLSRWRTVALLLLGPVVVLVVLRWRPRLDIQWFSAQAHLILVSAVALCALVAAVVAMATAVGSNQPGVVWLGLGSCLVGLFMLGHGLTTPGALGQPMNLWVSRLPYAGMWSLALCLVAAGRPPTWRPNRFVLRHPGVVLVVPSLAAAALVAWVSLAPLTSGTVPMRYEENATDVATTVAVLLLLWVIRTHWRRWHLGHDIVQFALVLGAASAIAALVAFEHGKLGHLSWWDYHGYLLAGFGGAVYAVFSRRGQERTLADILQTAFVDDPFEHIVKGYPEALRSLVRAVEVKDTYTHGHSERTARLAVELGQSMGMAPDRLRVIARGAYLHDVGKIGIPDALLNKPTALTAEERTVIQTHPQLGYELAATAPSLSEALPVILHHHERVDGFGYPGGLAGTDIPREARVVAVADVWDALTSDRAYRHGWPLDQALAHIVAGSGSHFDPAVVQALVRVVGGWGVRARDDRGQAEVAWEAAETCHDIDAIA